MPGHRPPPMTGDGIEPGQAAAAPRSGSGGDPGCRPPCLRRVFVGEGHGLAVRPVELFALLERGRVVRRVHQRVGVRVLEIIDAGTRERLELGTAGLGGWHGEDVLEQLD